MFDYTILFLESFYNNVWLKYSYTDYMSFHMYDYILRTDQIKQLYEWLYDTYKEMNKDAVNNVGIEYLLIVKKYLDSITTRVGTAYTQ